MMRTRLLSLFAIAATVATLGGQSSLPADIHPESLSRLPPVQRADLDDEGKRIWDAIASGGRGMPRTGPAAVAMYSPKAAEPIQALNQYLRKTVAGNRFFDPARTAVRGLGNVRGMEARRGSTCRLAAPVFHHRYFGWVYPAATGAADGRRDFCIGRGRSGESG